MVKTQIGEISTHLTDEEKTTLTKLASHVNGMTYVELGSYLGASSCFIAAGINTHNKARLYCVDTWINDGMSEGRRDTYAEFLENTRCFHELIVPLRGTTLYHAARFEKPIDFLFVDAGHDYENVNADVLNWFPKLKKGALVIFHDIGWATGVQKVVDEMVKPTVLEEGRLPNMYWAVVDPDKLPKTPPGHRNALEQPLPEKACELGNIYNDKFYEEQKDASYRSAEAIAPIVLEAIKAKSVIDVGCGVGGWLHVFQRLGVSEVCGYDVNDLGADKYFIPKPLIKTNSDFSSAGFRIRENSDLLICLEVAEHLPEASADHFVRNLAAAAPIIVFSAAIPGQTGVNHVNEQPPWYWREKFNRIGYIEIDFIRPRILRNEDICWWYRQNMTCFVRQEVLSGNPQLQALSRLHPQVNNCHKMTMVNEWVLNNILNGVHLAASSLPTDKVTPFLSVIIPTRDRSPLLYNALESLTKQSYPADRFEIIVVDNGSTDATSDVCHHFRLRIPRLKLVHAPLPGLHNGRHTGLAEASGEILVYADDDIEALPTWLEGIAESFIDPEVAMVGGKILPKFESAPPEWVNTLASKTDSGWSLGWYSLLDFGDRMHEIPHEYVWGCNFSIRKEVLQKVGGFHPDAFPQELIKYRGDGETAVSFAVREMGLKALYNPKAAVYHVVSSARLTAEYIYQRAFNQGVSDSYSSIRRNRALSGPQPYAPPSNTINETVNRGLVDGFNYHQSAVQTDTKLQEWVLRESYLGEWGVTQ